MRTQGLLLMLVVGSAAAAPIEVEGVKHYTGRDGQTLELATLKPATDRQVLVRLRATNSELDGLVLRGTLDARGTFVTRLHGADWALVSFHEGRGAVTAPGAEFTVTFSAGEPESPGDDLLQAHEQQTASGALAALARKPFPFLEKKYEAAAAKALASLNATCNSAATFHFEWARFSDDDLSNLDVWSLCEPLLATVKTRCAAITGVTNLTCSRGPKFALTRSGGALTFTTTEKGKADGRGWLTTNLGKP
jgi:hypothetical protein